MGADLGYSNEIVAVVVVAVGGGDSSGDELMRFRPPRMPELVDGADDSP